MFLQGNVIVIEVIKLYHISLIGITVLHTITLESGKFCMLLRFFSLERSYPSSVFLLCRLPQSAHYPSRLSPSARYLFLPPHVILN